MGNSKRNHTWFQSIRSLQSNRGETHEPNKIQSTDINATKEVLSTIRIQRTKRALPIRMISEFFFLKMKYEWAFREMLHLSGAEGRAYKPAACLLPVRKTSWGTLGSI